MLEWTPGSGLTFHIDPPSSSEAIIQVPQPAPASSWPYIILKDYTAASMMKRYVKE